MNFKKLGSHWEKLTVFSALLMSVWCSSAHANRWPWLIDLQAKPKPIFWEKNLISQAKVFRKRATWRADFPKWIKEYRVEEQAILIPKILDLNSSARINRFHIQEWEILNLLLRMKNHGEIQETLMKYFFQQSRGHDLESYIPNTYLTPRWARGGVTQESIISAIFQTNKPLKMVALAISRSNLDDSQLFAEIEKLSWLQSEIQKNSEHPDKWEELFYQLESITASAEFSREWAERIFVGLISKRLLISLENTNDPFAKEIYSWQTHYDKDEDSNDAEVEKEISENSMRLGSANRE